MFRVLAISNVGDAARRLEEDEKHTLGNSEGIASPQVQALTIINESGLYSLVLARRNPSGKRSKTRVTDIVGKSAIFRVFSETGNNPFVTMSIEEATADSRDVVAYLGRLPKNVLRDIRNLHCSDEFRQRNFAPIKINDLVGSRSQPRSGVSENEWQQPVT